MSTHRLDHVALEVGNLDLFIELLSKTGLMRLVRTGTLGRTGQRIAMLGDGTGVKLELIEKPGAKEPRVAHLAFAVEDVGQVSRQLTEQDWKLEHGPNELEAAKASSALLSGASGLKLQVIAYRSDSPDLARWTDADWPIARGTAASI